MSSNKKTLLRFYFVSLAFVTCLIIFGVRLILIGAFQSQYLRELSLKQHQVTLDLEPQRGIIYDCNLKPLAVNIPSYSLFAVPIKVKEKQKVVSTLSSLIELDKDFLLKRISSKKHFVWIKRKVPDKTMRFIEGLKIEGLFFLKETKRSYPNGSLAAHILGFSNIDSKGLEGIELFYDNYLKGKPGQVYFVRDAHQKNFGLGNPGDKMPVDGYDIILTIDQVIQYIAEEALDKAFKQYRAKGACIIVMDVPTGKILAMANRPVFDPNTPQGSVSDNRRNRAICDFFEPGSVFKIVAASAALEENAFTEEDKIFCENGSYRIANHILHDHTSHGWLTFSEVIEQSSNIGVSKIAQKLGLEKVHHYASLFGFGQLTNIGLPGEVKGMLKNLNSYSKVSIGALPMGHEVGVTALQLVGAISAVANGGLYFRPYIIDRIQDKYNETIKDFEPECMRRVISYETSLRLKKILARVVEQGTGKLAKSKDYSFAGKTGTAQKIEANGTYSHSSFFASFIGFAPVEKPRLAIAVIFDEPRGSYYGGVVCAPVFKEVAEKALHYLEVNEKPPSSAKSLEKPEIFDYSD